MRDDWRALPQLTICAGLRYTYFSPFAEKADRLSTLDYVPSVSDLPLPVQPNGIGPLSGAKYSAPMVAPERNNFSPHLGFAWQPVNNTVVRGGYGIHYTVGQYSSFIQYLAYQPPFANVQANGNQILTLDFGNGPAYVLLNTLRGTFSNSMAGEGNYAINPKYRLPYIQLWYADVVQQLPLRIILDASYVGSKGTRLDTITAPGSLNGGHAFRFCFRL